MLPMLTPEQLLKLARTAEVDIRTAKRWASGGKMLSHTDKALDRACRKLGYYSASSHPSAPAAITAVKPPTA